MPPRPIDDIGTEVARALRRNIKPVSATDAMDATEYSACLVAARLTNRQVQRLLGLAYDHEPRNWSGKGRQPCPPPAAVQRWLRGLGRAHIDADLAWPPPVVL